MHEQPAREQPVHQQLAREQSAREQPAHEQVQHSCHTVDAGRYECVLYCARWAYRPVCVREPDTQDTR